MDSKKIGTTPFIKKMISILQKPQFQHIISWDEGKKMIEVLDQSLLEEMILPQYFKHQKMESFVRQLNLYGFKKLRSDQYTKFRHDDLENGRSLHQIQTQRRIKMTKKPQQQSLKQIIQSSSKKSQEMLQNNDSKSIEIKKQSENKKSANMEDDKALPQLIKQSQLFNAGFFNPFLNNPFSMHLHHPHLHPSTQTIPEHYINGWNSHYMFPQANYFNPWGWNNYPNQM